MWWTARFRRGARYAPAVAQLLVLGTPEVVLTEGREPVVGTRRQTLLAMLSIHANADVGVAELIEQDSSS